MKKAEPFVVDTNVLLTADKWATHASDACVNACVRVLRQFERGHAVLVVDEGREILNEYRKNLKLGGQPTPARVFLKWALQNLWNPERCHQVPITRLPAAENGRLYAQFPESDALSAFDPDDQMFVAVSLTHDSRPAIIQATDSKWIGWKPGLDAAGVRVEFVCENELRKTYQRKFPE